MYIYRTPYYMIKFYTKDGVYYSVDSFSDREQAEKWIEDNVVNII